MLSLTTQRWGQEHQANTEPWYSRFDRCHDRRRRPL